MNKLYAGFGRINITPMLGIGLCGYYKTRIADGFLDDLEIIALALSAEEEKAVLISIDHCGVTQEIVAEFKQHIMEVTGISTDAIYIHATHTHTAPFLRKISTLILYSSYRILDMSVQFYALAIIIHIKALLLSYTPLFRYSDGLLLYHLRNASA